MRQDIPRFRRFRCSPALGAVQSKTPTDGAYAVQHERDRASRDTEPWHGNGQADQQPAVERVMPSTVLVTELDNGTLILQGRPDGPRVWLEPDEAVPPKRELAAAFARPKLAASDDQGQIQ
ncbi:MAG TPA: hypothetical protein VIY28_15485 [Pseudonocardiaceae bacterium]